MMNKNKKDIIELVVLGIILLALIFMLFLSGYKIKSNNTNKTDNNLSNEKTEISDKIDDTDINNDNKTESIQSSESIDNNKDNNIKDDVTNNNSDNDKDVTSNVDDNNVSDNQNIENEEGLVNYIMSLNNELDTYKNEDNTTFREKAKNIFVTVVDFLFYDKEIKGYKFKDLTYETKLKVLKICASIDNKIDEYFPNYKDKIKAGYENIKGKIAVKYLEYTSKLCDKVGEDNCSEFRTDFNNMKQSFGYTFSIIKEVASNASVKLVDILSEWYKSIK